MLDSALKIRRPALAGGRKIRRPALAGGRKIRRPALAGGRPFHLLLLSLAVSSLGDWLYNVALLALVFGRTGSPTWVALTTAARVLPIVVLGPLAGVLADRRDRRSLIFASDITRAVVMIALALVAATGLPIVLAPLLAAAATAAGSVQPPCVAASTARLVPDAELQRANALRAGIGQAAVVGGPAFGAALLAVSSPAAAIALNAISFLASAAAISAIPAGPVFSPAPRDAATRLTLVAEIRAGAHALRGASCAIRLVAADVLCSAVYGLCTVTLVLVSRSVGTGSGGYGLLLGAVGVGGVLGAICAGRLGAPSQWRPMLAIGLSLVAVALALLGVIHTVVLALAMAVLIGGGSVIGEVLSETALPRMLDESVLARAYGLMLPISLAGIVAGSLIAGPLLSLLGLQGALAAAGLSVLVGGALLLRRPLKVIPAPAALASPSL
ncbi:MAG TPA: MFS transporter [Solirubrobacteraceae bacterium]